MLRTVFACISFLALITAAVDCQLPVPADRPIRLGRFPSLSPDGARVCFSHQGNLWVAPSDGGVASRLTAADSVDTNPKWSPDGRWIAFNSDREGGSQIFLMPSSGGPVRQLTFHSSPTTVYDWFPGGTSLLVTTSRETRRESIYRLDVDTGRLKLLVSDDLRSTFPSLSPDGKWIAYTRGGLADTIRKNYRGAANYDIWIAPIDGASVRPPASGPEFGGVTGSAKRLTDSDKNDMWPAWSADSRTVFYCSERDGVSTIWKQPRDGGRPELVVKNPPDAVRYLSASRTGARLAYECENRIWALGGEAADLSRQSPRSLNLLCRTDERGPKTTYAAYNGSNVSEFALSPDGKRVVLNIRGDLFVASVDKPGDAARVTDTPAREAGAQWAPDGRQIVFASNRTGGFRLFLFDLGDRKTRQLTGTTAEVDPKAANKGAVPIDTDPRFSPDGKWIAFRRGPKTGLYLIKSDGSSEKQLAKGPKIWEFRWSPDSKWIAINQEDEIRSQDVWLVSVDGPNAINATDHPGYNEEPRWTSDGTKLVFRSNRYRNRDIETINHEGKYSLFSLTLEREKEKFDDDDPLKLPDAKPGATADAGSPAARREPPTVKIDAAEIERRARSIASPEEGVRALEVSPDGKTVAYVTASQGQVDLWQVGIEGGSAQRLTTTGEAPSGLAWSPDSARIYYLTQAQRSSDPTGQRQAGSVIRWVPKGGGAGGSISFMARMQIDRTVDYRAAFDEAWQILNDRFYDPTFHGVDWQGVGARYRALIDEVSVRTDFSYLMTQMLGELNASHTGYRGPDATRPSRETGYLGIWVDQDFLGPGVRVAAVMPRSPADRDESRLKPGDIILKIDGEEVAWGSTYDRALADKTGRTVRLDLASAAGTPQSTAKVKPISRAAWSALVYEKWIDERRAATDKASGGRLGYLHVSDMGDTARNRFERELFSIGVRKEGMVIDLRNNNGGDTHDSLLKILARNRHYFNFAPRTETPFPQPERAYTKPVILLINEQSLSDAEVFSNGFREYGLGKIVGVPTMGWIIFTSGTALVDGSFIRVPHLGCYTLDGRDMENWGVPPDIRVENSPADLAVGRDAQLERAVEELMKDKRLRK